MSEFTLANVKEWVGREIGVSEWLLVDQARIDQFAECTGDHQWIHVDVERAKRESPACRAWLPDAALDRVIGAANRRRAVRRGGGFQLRH